MKDIGAEIGVNESRVSQLHARAIQRLRVALGPETDPKSAAKIMTEALAAFRQKPKMLKAQLATAPAQPLRAIAGAKAAPATPAWTRMPVAMAAEKPSRPKTVVAKRAAAR
jgi:hypothetical protein